MADLLHTKEEEITFEFVDIQKQDGGSDCGLFTIAVITLICNSQDPTGLRYDQSEAKSLTKVHRTGRDDTFPISSWKEAVKSTKDCFCRLIDDGKK